MHTPSAPNRPVRGILRGCAVALILTVLLLTINAVYWTVRMRGGSGAAQTAPKEKITAEYAALPTGDPARGETLFQGQAECKACHSLQPGENRVGPSLAGVAQRAQTARAGYTAAEYLYESIAYPQAHVAQGFQGNIMPGNYRQRLSAQEMADLIAFLLARHSQK